MFGVFLCQEMISSYKRHRPHELSRQMLETMYEDTFNILLRKFCSDEFMKYDKKYHHNVPQCMVDGSLSYSQGLIEAMKAIEIIKMKREYNVSLKHITLSCDNSDNSD